MIARLFRRKPLVVHHVRYTTAPAISYREKAIAMALSMGRSDLVERLK